MGTTIVVEGKKINYTEIADADATVERLMQHLINGALTARMANMTDRTLSQSKAVKDIVVKTAFKR